MATLDSDNLRELRSILARNTATQTWTKPQLNAALQAVEDQMASPGTRSAIGNAIEAAAPGVFTVPMKETVFAVWCITYARRQGLL